MAITILGIEIWIVGIMISVAGYGIPQIIIREHPKKWAIEAQIISAIAVIIGIIIVIATK